MATERNFNAVPPVLLTSDGTTEGILQVQDTAGFYVQMQAVLQNNLSAKLTVYIKRVVDSTTLWVGPTKGGMDHNVDVSAFTVATSSTISAAEQPKGTVPMEGRLLATYENDPVDAWRAIWVDSYGNHYTNENPLPISFDGTVNIGSVALVGNPFPLYDQLLGTLTSPDFETIYSYTSSNDKTRVKNLDATVSTPSLIQVLINGVVIKQRWTSPMERNAVIEFEEPRILLTGDILLVQAKVERFIWSSYDTFVSWEGFLEIL